MTLLELVRGTFSNAGCTPARLLQDDEATRALHTTSDFPEILSPVTNAKLRQACEAQYKKGTPYHLPTVTQKRAKIK